MMDVERFVVAKAFNTVNRRLQVGEVVAKSELVLHDTQMTFEDRRKRHFLVGYDTKAAEKAAAKAAEAAQPLIAESPDPVEPPEDTSALAPEPELPAEPEMKQPSRR